MSNVVPVAEVIHATSRDGGAIVAPTAPPDDARFWLAAIAKSSSDAIVGKDLNGTVISWNKAAEAMFGYATDEIIGQSITVIVPPDRRSEEVSILNQIRRGEKVSQFETQRLCKDGRVIPVLLTISPIRDDRGRVIGVSKSARDLSEIQAIQRELKQREALLQQAQKMEAIGRLSAGVAHDFNNILQCIIGALELVQDDLEEDAPAREFTGIAVKAAVRGASLTQHLLSYARQQILRPRLINLASFLSDIQKLLACTLGPHIVVSVHAAGNPFMLVDAGQLETALLNLAINASHAMPQGGRLTIQARKDNEDGQIWTVLTVADTGIGMDETTLERAVEPFFTTKGLGGSGLGLSMVHGFIAQSGGKLHLTSVPGQGTTVELRMPAGFAGSQDVQQKAPKRRQASARILLVDDSTDVLATMSAFLTRAGFEVMQASGGNQALVLLATEGPFDALVTDFAMPGMNGADLIAEGRIVQPDLRALVITGFAQLSFVETLPGSTCVLHKPIQRKNLIEALHRLVEPDQGGVHEATDCTDTASAMPPIV